MKDRVPWSGVVVLVAGLAACGSVNDHPGADASVPIDSEPGDAAIAQRSCVGLAMTCGASQNEDCCDSPPVPGGSFSRSYAYDAQKLVSPMAPATVSDFRLDKYEVTVGRFRAFVAAGQGLSTTAPAAGAGAHGTIPGWSVDWDDKLSTTAALRSTALQCGPAFQTWSDAAADNENRPINCVSWYDAMAFCIWDGGYLPTEAQWMYASAGGDQLRLFPWSVPSGLATADASYASYSPDDGTTCVGDGNDACTLTDLLRVGADPKGAGRWGQVDLGGNVNEWVLDSFVMTYSMPCADCATVSGGTLRVSRGGSFNDDAPSMNATARFSQDPLKRDVNRGFRCARAP